MPPIERTSCVRLVARNAAVMRSHQNHVGPSSAPDTRNTVTGQSNSAKMGAPIVPVALGLAGAAYLTWRKQRKPFSGSRRP